VLYGTLPAFAWCRAGHASPATAMAARGSPPDCHPLRRHRRWPVRAFSGSTPNGAVPVARAWATATSGLGVMAAADADFRPKVVANEKLKKRDGIPEIVLEPTVDILAALGEQKTHQLLVGFAAETGHVQQHAAEKLEGNEDDHEPEPEGGDVGHDQLDRGRG